MLGFYQPISSWTHLLAAIVTMSLGYMLIKKGWGNYPRMITLSIFMLSVVFTFSMSGIFHALPPGMSREFFRRMDYAAIFIMIAGSSTPIHYILFRGWWRWGMLIFIWAIAMIGTLVTVLLIDTIPDYVKIIIYLMIGWTALISFARALRMYGFRFLRYGFYGGFFYTVGAIIEIMEPNDLVHGLVGHHEVFHVFVMAGAAFHWKMIYDWADQPTRDKIIFMVKEKSETSFYARALGECIQVHASSKALLREKIKEQMRIHFHPTLMPKKIRFRYYRDHIVNI
ncbi:MAG: PAQR family membrane homeostasis protein TrhA [Flavobacteriales bacterium]